MKAAVGAPPTRVRRTEWASPPLGSWEDCRRTMGPFSAFVSRGRRLGAFGALASAVLLGTATAQTTDSPGSSAILNVEKVPAGDVVYVTDNRRVTVKAVFAGVTSDAIELILDG